jgi:hypothetical protein
MLKRLISGVRVVVEHVIAGVKRCRIVKEVFRLTTPGTSDLVMEIACGLYQMVLKNYFKRYLVPFQYFEGHRR